MRKEIARNDFLYEGQVSNDVCDKLIQLHEEIPYLTDETKERDDYSFPFQNCQLIRTHRARALPFRGIKPWENLRF